MSVAELEKSVAALTAEELQEFADWFESYMAQKETNAWDFQSGEDFAAGRIDFLIEKARREFESGDYILVGSTLYA